MDALDRHKLGELLAAVGNHEAKALLFLAMEPDTGYGITALHQLFLAIQGHRPAHKGTVTLQQKYCAHSFEPAALAVSRIGPGGFLEHARRDPDGRASALAGHLLTATEEHPASLMQLFAKTAMKVPGGDRPPIRRLDLLRALVAGEPETHVSQLARVTGLPGTVVSSGLEAFARIGVVRFDTQPTYLMRSRYRVTARVQRSAAGGDPVFYNGVVDAINRRLTATRGAGVDFARERLEADLRAEPRWVGKEIRDSLTKTLHTLVERGQIIALQDYAGRTRHTTVTLDPGQTRFITDLVSGIDALAAGDQEANTLALAQGRAILGDPGRVRHLVAKVFAASKLITNPLSQQDKENRVLALLAECDGLTSAQIVAALTPDFSKPLALGTLTALAREGRITRRRQSDGPYNIWYR